MCTPQVHRVRGLLVVLASLITVGCAEAGVAPTGDLASIRVSANVSGTPISTLVLTVTGDGISHPGVFNFEVQNNQAAGTIHIPAGDARLFEVKAFDSNGDVTHEGSKTADVSRGQNPPVSIPLTPRNGQQPIEISMGDYSVVVTPGEAIIDIGETVQLSAEVTAPNGEHPQPNVMWATNDPSIATVNGGGTVTGRRGGSAQIVATYGGVVGMMNVIVRDASAPLSYQGPIYPPPGGVTYQTGNGQAGAPGGNTNTYRNFNLSLTRYLALGSDANDMPALMFNSTDNNATIDPNARMTFTMNGTDPANGVMVYVGQTFVPMANNTATPALTRLTVTVSQSIGGIIGPTDLQGAPPAWMTIIGGVAPITNAFSGPGDELRVHLQFEASFDNGNTWAAAITAFNNLPNKASSARSFTSFRGAFYFSY